MLFTLSLIFTKFPDQGRQSAGLLWGGIGAKAVPVGWASVLFDWCPWHSDH